jgi:hypothetical protein
MKTKKRNLPVTCFWCGLLWAAGLLLPSVTEAGGIWQTVSNQPSVGVGTMLLLSDGTVMATAGQDIATNQWFKLTPDTNGSYVNGTWTNLAPMNYNRLFFSSDVLTNGQVFVAGGEDGDGQMTAEIYDPPADVWAIVPIPQTGFIGGGQGNFSGFADAGSVVVSNGKVLELPVTPAVNRETVLYDPVSNLWTTNLLANPLNDEDEACTVKLPDDSILIVDSGQQTAERYIPSLNTWITDSNCPVFLYGAVGGEEGPAFLLPNGNAFFIGSSSVTAIYIPSGNTNWGGWVEGPAIPQNLGAPDAPAAMMVNGNILCALAHTPYLDGTNKEVFNPPTYFYEYNYNDGPIGTFIQVNAPNGSLTNNGSAYTDRMLDLPDGSVLFTDGNYLYVYQPTNGAALASGQPAINSVSWNADGSLRVSGTLFNGISQGAGYGDDAQMDSNYPLIRFTDGGSQVTYRRTYDWTSTSVQTGSRIVTTQCTMPTNIFYSNSEAFSLQVVANGNASDAITFYSPVWVNFDYTGATQNGSFAAPYTTLAKATNAVAIGGTIAIYAGVQPSRSLAAIAISKPMQIISVSGPSTLGN